MHFATETRQLARVAIVSLVIVAAATSSVHAEGAAHNHAGARLTPTQIAALAGTGASAGTSGVSGIQTRILKGDPTQAGLYTIQLEVPANTCIEAHEHPDDRVATVISGTWYLGYGDQHTQQELQALGPGSFYTEPAHAAHFARTRDTAVVLQISGVGPTGTRYLTQSPLVTQFDWPTGFQVRQIETNGAKIHVRVGGKGPAVILLHGYGETGDMWTPLAVNLARDHTVVVPDLRGLGLSSKPAGGFDKMTQAGDVAGVLDALRIDRADVVAHDIGNMVGFAFAAMFPQRVPRFALIDAPVPGVGPWDEILKNPLLWHFRFGGPDMERLVAGRERIYLDRFWNEFSANPQRFSETARGFSIARANC